MLSPQQLEIAGLLYLALQCDANLHLMLLAGILRLAPQSFALVRVHPALLAIRRYRILATAADAIRRYRILATAEDAIPLTSWAADRLLSQQLECPQQLVRQVWTKPKRGDHLV